MWMSVLQLRWLLLCSCSIITAQVQGAPCDEDKTKVWCSRGRSIDSKLKCDGINTCSSGKDEWGCGSWTCCGEQTQCGGGSNLCVVHTKRCDGRSTIRECGRRSKNDEADCDTYKCRLPLKKCYRTNKCLRRVPASCGSPPTPTLSVNPADTTIESGTSVTLTCSPGSSGVITYTFMKDNNLIVSRAGGTHVVSNHTIGAFNYTCKTNINTLDSPTSNYVTITSAPQTPTLSANPADTTIDSGTSVTLTCSTGNSGVITYTFMENSDVIVSITGGTHVLSTHTLGAFNYTCKTTINTLDSPTSNYVTITWAPQTPTLSANPADTTIDSGTSVALTSSTGSSGVITYTFMENSDVIASTIVGTYVLSTHTLGILNYACKVTINTVDSMTSNYVTIRFVATTTTTTTPATTTAISTTAATDTEPANTAPTTPAEPINCVEYCGIHTCSKNANDFTCICNKGYRNKGPKVCIDIDECNEGPKKCHIHECVNTPGSFHCKCNENYENVLPDLCGLKNTADPDDFVPSQPLFTVEIKVKAIAVTISTIVLAFLVVNSLFCLRTIVMALLRCILTKPVAGESVYKFDADSDSSYEEIPVVGSEQPASVMLRTQESRVKFATASNHELKPQKVKSSDIDLHGPDRPDIIIYDTADSLDGLDGLDTADSADRLDSLDSLDKNSRTSITSIPSDIFTKKKSSLKPSKSVRLSKSVKSTTSVREAKSVKSSMSTDV